MIDMFSLTTGIPQSLNKLLSGADKLLARHNKSMCRIKAEESNSKNNLKDVPPNATIREEHVKCKKYNCMMCPHGPYYYAYWKDEYGKLHKKYIGTQYDKTWKKHVKKRNKVLISLESR